MKKRTKKLLPHRRYHRGGQKIEPPADIGELAKVFWFFFSKKNFFFLLLLAAAAPDPVIAVRGTDSLTVAQLRALIASAPPDQRRKLQQDPELLKGLIRDTLLQHAILAEAAAQKWDQKPDVVAMLARVREAALLQGFLASQSAPPAGYPAESDVQAAYDHARPQLTRPRTYHLAQLFVPVAADAPSGAMQDARKKLASLQHDINAARISFEGATRRGAGVQYADLGWVSDTQLQKAARDTVAGLPEGQVSAPICSANGCTLIKLLATRPAGPPPLAEMHEQLVRAMREQKQKDLAQAYANALLAKAPVRVDEIQLSHLAAP